MLLLSHLEKARRLQSLLFTSFQRLENTNKQQNIRLFQIEQLTHPHQYFYSPLLQTNMAKLHTRFRAILHGREEKKFQKRFGINPEEKPIPTIVIDSPKSRSISSETLCPPPDSIKGRLFAITGAASGIGRATAKLLVESGALVTLADQDEKAVIQLAKELGSQAWGVKVDVTNRIDVSLWLKYAPQHWKRGGIDGEHRSTLYQLLPRVSKRTAVYRMTLG